MRLVINLGTWPTSWLRMRGSGSQWQPARGGCLTPHARDCSSCRDRPGHRGSAQAATLVFALEAQRTAARMGNAPRMQGRLLHKGAHGGGSAPGMQGVRGAGGTGGAQAMQKPVTVRLRSGGMHSGGATAQKPRSGESGAWDAPIKMPGGVVLVVGCCWV